MLKSILLSGAASMAVLTAVAAAQDPPPAPAAPTGVEEVTVTARKRAERSQSVPVAVTPIGKAQLESGVIRDVVDLEGIAPNVILDPIGAVPGGIGISIRGISFQDVEKSFDPAIGVLVDGVYLGTNTGARVDNFDLERIEVLRGPQGVLFGKNTTGGALNIIRAKPDMSKVFVKARVEVGSFSRGDFGGVVNIPLVNDQLAVKLSVSRKRDDGVYQNTFLNIRQGGEDQVQFTGMLRWEPSEMFNATLTYDHIWDTGDIAPLKHGSQPGSLAAVVFGAPGVVNFDRTVIQNFANIRNLELRGFTGEMNLDLGNWVVTSVTGFRDSTEVVWQDFDAIPVNFFSTIRPQDYQQFSQEIRFTSDFGPDSPLSLIFGGYYWSAEYELRQQTLFLFNFVAPVPPATEQRLNTGQTTTAYAVFADAQYQITERLRLEVGARYTWEDKDFNQFVRLRAPALVAPGNPEGAIPGTSVTFAASASWSEFTPKVLLDYKFSDDILAYASWARGFKSGGFSGRATSPTTVGPYEPEEVDTYELGLKSEFADRRVRLNVAAFLTNFKNQQVEFVIQDPNPAVGQQTVVKNAQKAEIRGLEVELTAVPVEGLTLTATLGLLDAKFTQFTADISGPGGVIDGINEDLTGQRLRRAPDFQYTLGAQYTWNLENDDRFTVGGSWTYFDDYATVIPNAPIPGVVTPLNFFDSRATGLLDLNASYEWGLEDGRLIKIAAYGKNVTNAEYVTAGLNVAGGALFSFYAVNAPATWGVELSAEF